MINFYELYDLDPKASIIDLEENLMNKHREVLRRLNNTVGDIDREYKIRKDLELVEDALKIFRSEEAKVLYDAELAEFTNANKKSGKLMSGKDDRIEENKRIQELIERQTVNNDQTANVANSNETFDSNALSKANNLIIRAKQFLDVGNFDDAKIYIDRALDENATSFNAWETMFFYFLQLHKDQYENSNNYNKKIYERTFRFIGFTNNENGTLVQGKNITEAVQIKETLTKVRRFYGRRTVEISAIDNHADDLDLVANWLSAKGPLKAYEEVYNYYKSVYTRMNLNDLIDFGYMYNDARTAFANAMKYANPKEKTAFSNKVLSMLQKFYLEDLEIVYTNSKNYAEEDIEYHIREINYYKRQISEVHKKFGGVNKTKNRVISGILTVLSVFMASLYLYADYNSMIGKIVYNLFLPITLIFSDTFNSVLALAKAHTVTTLIITMLILVYSLAKTIDFKDKLMSKINEGIMLSLLGLIIYYTLKSWYKYILLGFAFRAVVVGYGLYFLYNRYKLNQVDKYESKKNFHDNGRFFNSL